LTGPDALQNRLLLLDLMDLIEEIGPGRADLRERRLAARYPELGPEERQQVLQYCDRFETAVWLCAKQVHEGGVEIGAGAACLAEQFPELDIDQIDRKLTRAMAAKRAAE
jgi:hypothetical protein